MRRQILKGFVQAGAAWMVSALAQAHESSDDARLPKIGPAPGFILTAQNGRRVSLDAMRGKVTAVTFIYASCTDTCPLLTAKMAALRKRLGSDFGSRVCFASITVDPEHDTPEVLSNYAAAHGADVDGWVFLTGSTKDIRDVARRYGVFISKQRPGDVDHTFLTSLIDSTGTLRVQYMGYRFSNDEMLQDIRALIREGAPK